MEEVKKKNPIRKFLDWLKTPDDDEFVDGELNIKAFGDESNETIEELKKSNKKIDEMGKSFFEENKANYKKRIKTQGNVELQGKANTEKDNIKIQPSGKSSKVQEER